MSDASFLAPQPYLWEHQGKTYAFAVPDLELELIYQAEHEAWARNRLEATRGKVDRDVHAADVARHVEMVAANRFAFRGPLSMSFLGSEAGLVEYLLLLGLKGGRERPTREFLRGLARSDRTAWGRLVDEVLARDFPEALATPPATPAPSTSASSSSSPASPG